MGRKERFEREGGRKSQREILVLKNIIISLNVLNRRMKMMRKEQMNFMTEITQSKQEEYILKKKKSKVLVSCGTIKKGSNIHDLRISEGEEKASGVEKNI